ncbi:MAG: hypothetical protein MJZ64_06300 [Paludibacteraceae bacterium]|nr:hypothetical protein [Paludibacteraceae bacterium]
MKKEILFLTFCTIICCACDLVKDDPRLSGTSDDEFIPFETNQHFEYLTVVDFTPLCGFPISVIDRKLKEKGYSLVDRSANYNREYYYTYRNRDQKDSIQLCVYNDSLKHITYGVSNRGMTPKTARLWLNQMGNKCLLPTNAQMLFSAAQSGPAFLITTDIHPYATFDGKSRTYEYDYFLNNILSKTTFDYGIWGEWFNVGYTQYPDIREIRLRYLNCNEVDYGCIKITFLNIK